MHLFAICDDEPLHRERLVRSVQNHLNGQHAELRLFASPAALLQEISAHGYTPDVVIVDIQMGEMSGIDLATRINEALPQCAVIFATSYLGFATEVYETEHAYFILKSEFDQRIGAALQKALTRKPLPILHYPVSQGFRNTPCSQVLCMERILRRTKLTLLGGAEEWTPLTPAELLEADSAQQFIRCHQSYWVNCRAIVGMEHETFCLSDGTRVPISRSYRKNAREAFFRLLAGRTARLDVPEGAADGV